MDDGVHCRAWMFAYGVSSPATEIVDTETEQSIAIELGAIPGFFAIGSVILYFVMLAIFACQLTRHNKKNPTQKISLFSIRPLEYLEQDEGMTYITRKASQKVYTFITWSLPLLAAIAIVVPIPRLYIIWGILLIALGQYCIYYIEIRKHLKEESE